MASGLGGAFEGASAYAKAFMGGGWGVPVAP